MLLWVDWTQLRGSLLGHIKLLWPDIEVWSVLRNRHWKELMHMWQLICSIAWKLLGCCLLQHLDDLSYDIRAGFQRAVSQSKHSKRHITATLLRTEPGAGTWPPLNILLPWEIMKFAWFQSEVTWYYISIKEMSEISW